MKRYDTFTPRAKETFERTLKYAKLHGKAIFDCFDPDYNLVCKECPMYRPGNDFTVPCVYNPKSAAEWLAWANEEVNDETN